MKIEFPLDSDLPRLKQLWSLGFSDPMDAIEGFFETGFSKSRCRLLRIGGEIPSVLYWFDTAYRGKPYAYIYALTTDPAFRGRGLAKALMEDTHSYLKELGYAAVLLYPGSQSLRSFYRSLGYSDTCRWGQLTAAAEPGEKVEIDKISLEAFAALRPRFLPETGVIQEGENLRFLSRFAEFYKGEDFLLVAAREENTLLGLELLGNTQAAGAIVAALGCRAGSFRIPAGDGLGAMFYPLREDGERPEYFGLVFD